MNETSVSSISTDWSIQSISIKSDVDLPIFISLSIDKSIPIFIDWVLWALSDWSNSQDKQCQSYTVKAVLKINFDSSCGFCFFGPFF